MRRVALVLLIAVSIACVFPVLGSLPLLAMTAVLFDASGWRGSIGASGIAAGLLAVPLLVGLGLVRGWRAFRREAYREALLCLWLPALGVGLGAAAIWLFPMVCGTTAPVEAKQVRRELRCT